MGDDSTKFSLLATILAVLRKSEGFMGNLSQAGRPGTLKTPLGEDVLVLKSFSGAEGLGELFEFHVEALSEQANINFDNAIGQACTLRVTTYKNEERFFCGILTDAQWAGRDPQYSGDQEKYYAYRLVLRPWFWLLAHRADCRIFLDKKVTEIIDEVFKKAGFSSGKDYQLPSGSYDKIEYCVQYRETDFTFVSRLMEQYGIYYYFEHKDGQHTMVLSDSNASHKEVHGLPQIKYNPAMGGYNRQEQNLISWVSDRQFCTGKVEFNDYDYLKPPKDLKANKEASEKYQHSKFEVYDYPGKHDEKSKGEDFAKFRLEAEQSLDHRRHTAGDAPSLYAGGLVTVQDLPKSDDNQQYLIVRARHQFGTQQYAAGTGQGSVGYSGSYEFQPKDRQFRMLPLTPKPRIYGIQTAKVVTKKGEDGEEISTDEHGRIWVKFFWDREPQKTCPIRVAQVWASKQWGGQFIPRVDMEVVVEFLEGDPDRPLVTGCVFNGDNHYPFNLPDNKTQSGWKSDSSKGHDGYNQIMFEDKKGSEDIVMHAEKDHDAVIKDTQTFTIGESFTSHKGPASRDWTLKKGDDNLEISAGNQKVHIAKTQQINVDNDITITSLTKITLKVGSNQVVIDQMGVHIQGMQIDLQANAQITQQAPMININ
jgi:type VI secretion system secreted protein VgrG